LFERIPIVLSYLIEINLLCDNNQPLTLWWFYYFVTISIKMFEILKSYVIIFLLSSLCVCWAGFVWLKRGTKVPSFIYVKVASSFAFLSNEPSTGWSHF
jgi:hypothetical protein